MVRIYMPKAIEYFLRSKRTPKSEYATQYAKILEGLGQRGVYPDEDGVIDTKDLARPFYDEIKEITRGKRRV